MRSTPTRDDGRLAEQLAVAAKLTALIEKQRRTFACYQRHIPAMAEA